MTEQIDLDALIAEVREWLDSHQHFHSAKRTHVRKLADALESTLAGLRQERERADEAWRIGAAQHGYDPTDDEQAGNFMRLAKRADRAEADLSRAEETIEKVLAVPNEFEWDVPPTAKHILNEYGKQKEADRG